MSEYVLQWRYNERDGVSNHQPYDCLFNRLFKAQVKENVTGLCAGNSPVMSSLVNTSYSYKCDGSYYWIFTDRVYCMSDQVAI